MEFNDLIQQAHEATEKHGADIKGKKYLSVAHRIELFRRHYGDGANIVTDVVQLGTLKGEVVVMKASAVLADGRTVAVGHAAEVIGLGMINANSALENCETSAVGRCLAILGLHGGEMASLNEIQNATNGKPENFAAEGLENARRDAEEEQTPKERAETFRNAFKRKVDSIKTVNGLDNVWDTNRDKLDKLRDTWPELFGECVDIFENRKNDITESVDA